MTFRFKSFFKIYMDYCFWFNFPPPQIEGVDFKEIFLLSIPGELILRDHQNTLPEKVVTNILNKEFLDYNSNERYETTERIRLYDREEYYPREQLPNIPTLF